MNQHRLRAVFDIHSSLAYGDFRRFIGKGFLVSQTLAVTSHLVIPSESIAQKSFAIFPDAPTIVHRFDARKFFYTSKDLKFTLVGIERVPGEEHRIPLPIHKFFKLEDGQSVVFYWNKLESKNVLNVDEEMFTYTAGTELPGGLPIFDFNWELQGIHHTSTLQYKLNQATRIDMIYQQLLSMRHLMPHPELDMMMEAEGYEVKQLHIEPAVNETVFHYWFEWFTTNVYRFDTSLQVWGRLEPSNKAQLAEQHGRWYFAWNSRTAYTSSGNAVIVGGLIDNKGTITNDVWLYRPNDNTLHKLPGMIEAREAPAVVAYENIVYVLGGRYPMNSVEMFSLNSYDWKGVAPMVQGRYDHSACLLQNNNYIYVVGGCPVEVVGTTIERYYISDNRWELLTLTLPEPLQHFGIFPVSRNRLAIIGGKFCKRVLVFEINENKIDTHFNPRYLMPESDVYRLHEVQSLSQDIETIFPVLMDSSKDKILILTGKDGYGHLKVVPYPFSLFMTLHNPVRKPNYLSQSYLEVSPQPASRSYTLLPPYGLHAL
eukprot:CAMPEP_0204902034 /NCGR_PEP_ID=MMETSP1397-20131031/3427_1 /ASSEMBLY_ACC=CAM_ASM_000891 /TAXON_ID=49980 /ORGANISM="Climacostomum Climacostomum virens, Strain Stock W-24" /LENGTH=540 /DNA_ID=CAMNT_0052070477 /DNA_START=290 /DNA_END=1912 /DNA_ORIENTATION=-